MKTSLPFAARLLILGVLSYHASLFGQGSLTPPTAPTPSMKTLDQIEARTPISSAPFTISASGSYYLTNNVTVSSGNAITIAASNVTLNLNGFTISSTRPTATTDSAISLGGSTPVNIVIYNGHISSGVIDNNGTFSGSGFNSGISASVIVRNVRVKDVSVAGVLNDGIFLGHDGSAVVESCTVNLVGRYGIYADSVSDSTAFNCAGAGIYADTARHCKALGLGGGSGLTATAADNCYGYSTGSGYGLEAQTATNCYGESASGTGLSANIAQNCYGYSDLSGPGLNAETANNCYGVGVIRGVSANIAIACSGRSTGGSYGVFATSIANTCYGISATGTGLGATIAIGCIGVNNSGPSVLATYRYNMPP